MYVYVHNYIYIYIQLYITIYIIMYIYIYNLCDYICAGVLQVCTMGFCERYAALRTYTSTAAVRQPRELHENKERNKSKKESFRICCSLAPDTPDPVA